MIKTAIQSSAFNTTSTIHSTIDTILTEGAKKLYGKYINSKLPSHNHHHCQQVLDMIYEPVFGKSPQGDKGTTENAEPKTNRIAFLKKGEGRRKKSQGSKLYPQKMKKQGLNLSLHLQSRLKSNKNNTKINFQTKFSSALTNKQQQKQQTTQLIFTDQNNFIEEQTEEQIQIKAQKMQRVEKQIEQQKQRKNELEKKMLRRKKLEQKFKCLEEENRAIAFDHQTGIFIQEGQEEHKLKNNRISNSHKNNVVAMKYDCSEQKNKNKHLPEQQPVAWTRKVTSYGKPKRKRILLDGEDQNVQENNFNNNGNRQRSSIPFMTVQDGIYLKQQGGGQTNRRNIASARASSASTHRTFKSYTRQKMESTRYCRTINTATSGGRTRYIAPSHKTSMRSQMHSRPDSILWSSQKSTKHHKISKNDELVTNFFDFSEQVLQ